MNIFLAEKWHITPDKVDDIPVEWVVRQLEYDDIKSSFDRVKNAKTSRNKNK